MRKSRLRGYAVLCFVIKAEGKLDRGTAIQQGSGVVERGREKLRARGWVFNQGISLQRNRWDSWNSHGIDGTARNPMWKTSQRDLRGKAISLWAEGARIWNHYKRLARFKEGPWARLVIERDDLHKIHSKGEGNNGRPRGKSQRPPPLGSLAFGPPLYIRNEKWRKGKTYLGRVVC